MMTWWLYIALYSLKSEWVSYNNHLNIAEYPLIGATLWRLKLNLKLTSKLANHIALFWSHDNIGYLVKYFDQSLDWIKINSPHFKQWFIRMKCHFKSSNSDWTTNFKSSHFDPVSASPRTWLNYADLKSNPVFIVGFEILLKA
jgi:hypothetical protein